MKGLIKSTWGAGSGGMLLISCVPDSQEISRLFIHERADCSIVHGSKNKHFWNILTLCVAASSPAPAPSCQWERKSVSDLVKVLNPFFGQ